MEEEGGAEEGVCAALAPEQPPSCPSFADRLAGGALIKGSPLRSWCKSEHKLRARGGRVSSGVPLGPGRAEAPATHARRRTKSVRPHEAPQTRRVK